MDQANDFDRFRRRDPSARLLAGAADDDQIGRLHTKMADRYAAKIDDLTTSPQIRRHRRKASDSVASLAL